MSHLKKKYLEGTISYNKINPVFLIYYIHGFKQFGIITYRWNFSLFDTIDVNDDSEDDDH